MKPSFQTTIENQFDYICKRVMKTSERIICFIFQGLQSEVSFSDVGDYLVSQFATTDNYSMTFRFLHSMGYQ